MKNLIKRIACTVLALATVMLCGVFAAADTVKIISAPDAINGVVWIRGSYGGSAWSGTGFAIGDPNKPVEYIVTNSHVVTADGAIQAGAAELRVYYSYAENDFQIPTVYKIDEVRDLAVLKLPSATTKRTALVIAPSSEVVVGEDVSVIGYPGVSDKISYDHKYDLSDITITKGGVSKKTTSKFHDNAQVYQTDADINHGNSGGPLVNSKGQVIGINTFTYTPNGEAKLNYSVCADELLTLISGSKSEIGYVLSTEISDEAPATSESKPAENDNDNRQSVPAASEKSGSSATTVIIIVAVVVVVAAAGVVVVMMKKKGGSAPAAAASAAPASSPVQITPPQNNAGAVLVGEKGILAGRTYPIGNGVVIGRNPQQCNVCFPVDAKGVSGSHCAINKTANGFEIVDLGSSYGTTLGSGQKLTPNVPVHLPSGTYIMVGGSEQVFQIKY